MTLSDDIDINLIAERKPHKVYRYLKNIAWVVKHIHTKLRIGLNFKINTYLYVLFPWLCKQLKCVLKDTDKLSLDINTLTFQAFLRCLWCPRHLLQSLQEIHRTKDAVPIARASHWHEKEKWKGNCNTGQNEARSTWSHRKLWKHLEGFIYKGGSVGQSLENENRLRRREPGWESFS